MLIFANIRFPLTALLAISFCLLSALKAHAQAPSFSLENMPPPALSLSYGSPDTLLVKVAIAPGWHVNANVTSDEFLLPSRVEAGAKGMTFSAPLWPSPFKEYSEALQMENLVFKDTFFIKLPVATQDEGADPQTTHVVFHYQACSNFICLAPGQVSASLNSSLSTPLIQDPALLKKKASFLEVMRLLLLAFAGGLLLNLMPCVLPVLSLKVFSLVRQSHESRSRILLLGASTTAGILSSFWMLALAVVALRSAGGLAGWGFQFQHIGFIAFMSVLLTLFAANLFGAFEIWLPGKAMTHMDHYARKEGLGGAFFHGALLTLLSTPCSAPFLGTAMGFAFGESGLMLFLFFGAAGFGLSLPYLLVSAFPSLVRWMPKPGNWMVRFKQFLGFPLLATVAWLLWVLGQQAGADAMAWMLALLCLVALAGWLAGWLAPPGQPFWKALLVWGLALALLIPLWLGIVSPAIAQGIASQAHAREARYTDGWQAYSPELMEDLASQGKTVFLDFTADWCITCKANEKGVLSRDTVRAAFAELDVALVKADWTSQDAAISKLLAAHGRSGVPFYLVYPGGDHSRPMPLPELLTVESVLTALEKAGPSLR